MTKLDARFRLPGYFEAVMDGRKPFDLRLNDRDYRPGDRVRLMEYDPDKGYYTGREITLAVSYVLDGIGPGAVPPLQGLARGYCVLGFARPAAAG